MKKLLSKIYIIACMGLTVFFMVLIWNLTFGKIVDAFHSKKRIEAIAAVKKQTQADKDKEMTSFREAILEGEETVKHYLGYRVLEQKRIMGHFHHIDFELAPDKRNYCIQCHGEMPHDKVKEVRAFGNMHASFIGCQTCHVRLEKAERTGVFKWYDRTSGEIVESPVKEKIRNWIPTPVRETEPPGTYSSKIIPFERINGNLVRVDTQERIDFVRDFRKEERSLSDLQKAKALKIIHNVVSKEPYRCEDCHQKEAPLLPFAELGYPAHRVDAIVSTEVVGMIKNYTEFYMPRLLHPGESEK